MDDPQIPQRSPTPAERIGDDELENLLRSAKPPKSWVAWVGFVLALVLLAPWVPLALKKFMGNPGLLIGGLIGLGGGVLATVLGIIGVFRTRRRRRGGRLPAIAAIPLGLAAGLVQFAVGSTVFSLLSVRMHSNAAVQILRSPSSEIAERARTWHEQMASQRFQVAVSPEMLTGWLNDVFARHGQLQSGTSAQKKAFGAERGATVYRLNGQFVNGTVPIEVVVGFDKGIQPKVDDIRVDGSSPRAWKPAEKPETPEQ